MRFPRQDYWTGMPFPSPGDLSDPGTEPASPALSGRFFTLSPLGSHRYIYIQMYVNKTGITHVTQGEGTNSSYMGFTSSIYNDKK